MNDVTPTEQQLLKKIRSGDFDAWSQLVADFQGRLTAFALVRVPQAADADDVVQETFLAFLKGVNNYRGAASLETYLFTILRHKIIDSYRSKAARAVCLIQNVYNTESIYGPVNIIEQISATDPTASFYLRRSEQHYQLRQALAQALRKLIEGFRETLMFRDLKIAEMFFYGKLSNKDAAELIDEDAKLIKSFKHRCLTRIRESVAKHDISLDISPASFENLLTDVWESQRLSCPKRSTLHAFLQETLEPEWFDYVDFHLTTLGCHFCRASYKDLKCKKNSEEQRNLQKQIIESTIGFLRKL